MTFSFYRIAQTAESAGYALWNHDGASASSKVDELKASISKVSEMLDRLSVSKSDQSRKRYAAELDEGRSVKSLKREPQEDLPLSLPQIDPNIPVPAEQSPTYPTPLSAHPMNSTARPIAPLPHSDSQSPSREPTPPKAPLPSRSSFTPPKLSAGPGFSVFMPPSPAVEFPPTIVPLVGSPIPFGAPSNSQWAESVGSTSRHHHSLSAGAITSPIQAMPLGGNSAVPRSLDPFSPSVPAAPPPMITPSTSAISPPIGRMSRSGSITGVPYNTTFSFNYSTTEAPGWHTVSQPTQNLPPPPQTSRPRSQSNWYFGPSEHSGLSASPSTTSDVSSTMVGAAPTTTRSTPTDPEDNDDDHDSDSSETHHKPSLNKKVSSTDPVGITESLLPK
jgi:hypothetical protein